MKRNNVYYHGTTQERLKDILTHGLKLNQSPRWTAKKSPNGIFVTRDPVEAIIFGLEWDEVEKSTAVLFKIMNIPKNAKIVDDVDAIRDNENSKASIIQGIKSIKPDEFCIVEFPMSDPDDPNEYEEIENILQSCKWKKIPK